MAVSPYIFRTRFAAVFPGTKVSIVRYTRIHDPVLLNCPIHGELTASSGANLLRAKYPCPQCGLLAGRTALTQAPTYRHPPLNLITPEEARQRLDLSPTPDLALLTRDPLHHTCYLCQCPRHGTVSIRTNHLVRGCPKCRRALPDDCQ